MQTHPNHSFNVPILRNGCIYKPFIGSVMLNIRSDTSMNIRVWIRDRRYSYPVPLWRELFITCFWVHRYLSCIPCRQFTFFRAKRSSQYLIRLHIDVCCYKVMSLILNIYLDWFHSTCPTIFNWMDIKFDLYLFPTIAFHWSIASMPHTFQTFGSIQDEN